MMKRSKSEDVSNRKARVLMMHGYESGPGGVKTKALQAAGFDVLAPDMRPLLTGSKAKRDGMRSIVALVGVAGCLAAFNVYHYGALGGPANLLVAVLFFCLLHRLLMGSVRAVIGDCAGLQMDAIKQFCPDIIVGSSFGGLVALHCLREGAFRGPALVLAPAICGHWTVNWLRNPLVQLPNAYHGPCLIIHGTADSVCPIGDSREFVRRHPVVNLLEIEGGDHRLHAISNSLADHVNQLIAKARSRSIVGQL
ncbi:MAG: hypothetical protein Q8P67_19640 [archaeon]|nr:hypothetical protein [archaeon]